MVSTLFYPPGSVSEKFRRPQDVFEVDYTMFVIARVAKRSCRIAYLHRGKIGTCYSTFHSAASPPKSRGTKGRFHDRFWGVTEKGYTCETSFILSFLSDVVVGRIQIERSAIRSD